MEKYEEQQISEQPAVEEQPVARREENSQPLLDKNHGKGDEVKKVEKPNEDVKQVKKQSFPTWMLVLLVSFVGLVMALPLLQL